MGALEKLKQHFFGGFVLWLKNQKIDVRFSNDVWASKIFDRFHSIYEAQTDKFRGLTTASVEELEAVLSQKKKLITEEEKAMKEKEDKSDVENKGKKEEIEHLKTD